MATVKGVDVHVRPTALKDIRDIVYNRGDFTTNSKEEQVECLVDIIIMHGNRAFNVGYEIGIKL